MITAQRELKNCQRVTFSLPKSVVSRLYKKIPKSKRSGYVAKALELSFMQEKKETKIPSSFWEEFWKRNPPKTTGKSAVELVREDRSSH